MSLCILTDTTALILQTAPNGGKFAFPSHHNMDGSDPQPPDLQDYLQIFTDLEHEFKAILVLTGSDAIFAGLETARQAAQSHGGSAKIEVLDTLQIGAGLSMLTQLAARKAATGMGLLEAQAYLRTVIPNLFTIICPDNLPNGPEDNANPDKPADPANTMTVYSLEEGLLSPYKKARTQRHMLEIFQEFLEEFETPQQVCFFHGKNTNLHIRPLRESIQGLFPGTQFTELELNERLTGLFGEHTAGLTVLEMPREHGL